MVKFYQHRRYSKRSFKGKTLYSSDQDNISAKEDWDAYKRLGLTFVVTLAFAVFVYLWGIRIVNTISSFWLKVNGPVPSVPGNTASNTLIFPPRLDSLPGDINDLSKLKLAGWAPAGSEVVLFINQQKEKTVLANATGRFVADDISLKEGKNEIYAIAVYNNKTKSRPSETQQINFDKTKPELIISQPEQNATVKDANNQWLAVAGSTEPNAQVFINENQAIVEVDGNFKYQFPLQKGENKLKIVARDQAGNETVVERTVVFEIPASPTPSPQTTSPSSNR